MTDISSRARPPGPTLLKAGLIAARLTNPIFTFLPELARRYGDVVDVPVPGRVTMTLVSHPEHIEHVMTRHHARYRKHESTDELFFGEPPPLPLLLGDEWKRTRRELSPHFSEQALAAGGAQLVGGLVERVADWDEYAASGRTIVLQHELGVAVMDGLMRSLFSTVLSVEQLERFVSATRDYARYVLWRTATYALPSSVPRPTRKRGEQAKLFIFSQLDELITQRRTTGSAGPGDVLDVLLAMHFTGSAREQYARLRSELAALVLAAIDTTTAALGWVVALLCENPAALARAYAEVDALDDAVLQYRHLQHLNYLRCCFDESQRIQSATLANIRTTAEDDFIGGYFIPAGSHVLVSPYGLHRDPRFWKAPEEFRPSRFAEADFDRNAFMPFNIGPRKCMGFRLANNEGVLTLAAILQRYRVHPRPGWQLRHGLRGGSGLPEGLPATLERRSAAVQRVPAESG